MIEPPAEEAVGATLLEKIPQPVAIVAESESPDLGISQFDLANGVRVLVMPTDFKDDEILFTGFSLGGSSLVSDEDYPEASTIVKVITESGVGAFGQSELEKLLTGKDIAISPYLRELTEGIEGNSSVADLETLFQLIYLYITQPRADQDAFEVFQKQMRVALENRALDPNSALQDALNAALYGDTIRRGTLPIEEVDALDLDRAFEIYQERFADMDDAVFIFVGNVDAERSSRWRRPIWATCRSATARRAGEMSCPICPKASSRRRLSRAKATAASPRSSSANRTNRRSKTRQAGCTKNRA